MSNHMAGSDFSSLENKDLRGTKTGRGGFIPPETDGNDGGPGPASRGKEANTARVLGLGREMSKAEIKDPVPGITQSCDETKGW